MKKRDIILFVSIFMVLLLVTGGTYAYWVWNSPENKSVVFNTSKAIEEYVIYDEGESHFVGDLQIVDSLCEGVATEISFGLNTENLTQEELEKLERNRLVATINMDINSIGSVLSSTNALRWAVIQTTALSDGNLCSGSSTRKSARVLDHGNFQNMEEGTTFELSSFIPISSDIQQYSVVIWLDDSYLNGNEFQLSGETIDVNVWTRIDATDSSVCRIHYIDMSSPAATPGADSGAVYYQDIIEGEPFNVISGPVGAAGSYYFGEDWENDCYNEGDTVTADCGTIVFAESAMCLS